MAYIHVPMTDEEMMAAMAGLDDLAKQKPHLFTDLEWDIPPMKKLKKGKNASPPNRRPKGDKG